MEMCASSGLAMLREEHACGVKPLPAVVGRAIVPRTLPVVGLSSSTFSGSARHVEIWQLGEPATTTITLSKPSRGKGDCDADGDTVDDVVRLGDAVDDGVKLGETEGDRVTLGETVCEGVSLGVAPGEGDTLGVGEGATSNSRKPMEAV